MATNIFTPDFYRSNHALFSAVQRRSLVITESVESFSKRASQKTTVFISHKHDDLNGLEPLISMLEENYSVETYIDSKDRSMPKVTNSKTAARIKNMINKCDKFILLATDGAIESKWCNWELGYGDAAKFAKKSIAIFVVSNDTKDAKGCEYMKLYPYISCYAGNEKYKNGSFVERGYYVSEETEEGLTIITPLSDWLKSRS